MPLIGKILLGFLLLIFGFLALGVGVCATVYTMDSSGISLLFGLPLTAVLGIIAYLLWRALQGSTPAPTAPKKDEHAP